LGDKKLKYVEIKNAPHILYKMDTNKNSIALNSQFGKNIKLKIITHTHIYFRQDTYFKGYYKKPYIVQKFCVVCWKLYIRIPTTKIILLFDKYFLQFSLKYSPCQKLSCITVAGDVNQFLERPLL